MCYSGLILPYINSLRLSINCLPYPDFLTTMSSSSSSPYTTPAQDASRARLRAHFSSSQNPASHPRRWDDLWKAGDFLPWDRGVPNPALVDTLEQKKTLLGPALAPSDNSDSSHKVRRKALVPGCGRGYDVFLLASFGYDAVGVEASENAVKAAREEQAKAEKDGSYPVVDREIGAGSVQIVEGDFFADDWVKKVGAEGGFDLIYDYTVSLPTPPVVFTLDRCSLAVFRLSITLL